MTQFSVEVRNARANAVEQTIGASPTMEIRSGLPPANTAQADTGTVLATIALPADYLTAAAAGVVSKSGTWDDQSADAAGRAAHYRIKNNAGNIVHVQGYCAMAWEPDHVYAVNDLATNDGGKLYRATSGGTSASSGGPTGSGTGIADNTVVWEFVKNATDMAIDNAEFQLGQEFVVTTYGWTEGNA